MADGPRVKRFRPEGADPANALLQRLVNTGGVSNRGLSQILQQVKAHTGADLGASRFHVDRAYHARFDSVKHVEKVQLKDGTMADWELAHPNRLLSELVSHSPGLAGLFGDAMKAHPVSMEQPWSLVVGFDEFAPGNKLKVDNRRKCMVLSFTFLELGQAAMSSSSAWVIPVCVRSKLIQSAQGGWSNLLKRFLTLQLLGAGGLATSGVAIVVDGSPKLLFAKLTNILTDGDGFRIAFDWKGHASLKPCFRHVNVLKKGSDLASRRPGYVEITCHDETRFREWSAGDLAAAVDMLAESSRRLEAGATTRARHDALELATGLNFNRHGLLADLALRCSCNGTTVLTRSSPRLCVGCRWQLNEQQAHSSSGVWWLRCPRPHVSPAACMTSDWVHNMLQDGTLTTEACGLVQRITSHHVVFSVADRSQHRRLLGGDPGLVDRSHIVACHFAIVSLQLRFLSSSSIAMPLAWTGPC